MNYNKFDLYTLVQINDFNSIEWIVDDALVRYYTNRNNKPFLKYKGVDYRESIKKLYKQEKLFSKSDSFLDSYQGFIHGWSAGFLNDCPEKLKNKIY